MMGLARTGASGDNGSGDYAIAFSTAAETRILSDEKLDLYVPRNLKLLSNNAVSPLFLAVIEAPEEAILNSLFRAVSLTGRGNTVEAIPINRTIEILRKYKVIK
jgi:D-aminopeptidase